MCVSIFGSNTGRGEAGSCRITYQDETLPGPLDGPSCLQRKLEMDKHKEVENRDEAACSRELGSSLDAECYTPTRDG